MSMAFVWIAVLGYATANYLMRVEARVSKAIAAARKKLADKPAESTSTGDVQLKVAGSDELLQEVKASTLLGRVDRALLRPTGAEPKLYVKDQHVDIFCRYLFPLAYAIAFVAMWCMVPGQPEPEEALRSACQ